MATDFGNSKFDMKILSSSHINFLFGSGVNGKAFPQFNGFTKTLNKLKEFGCKKINLEEAINELEDESQKSKIHSIFIDELKWHSKSQVFYIEPEGQHAVYADSETFDPYLNDIDIELPEDKLDRFLFELYFAIASENENGVNLDFLMPLASRAQKLISDFKKVFDFSRSFNDIFDSKQKNIAIVQLANVNKDMKEIIPSIIATNVFNILQKHKEEKDEITQVVSIVVDEAHNILYEDSSSKPTHSTILEAFERVVKEGRKFGMFLMLASQRPSDISPTIISQLHNYFIHKLVNPSDIAIIRKAVAYMDEKSMDFVTILSPGECIVSGTAFQMPTFVYVSQLEVDKRPKSENVILFGKDGLLKRQEVDNDL